MNTTLQDQFPVLGHLHSQAYNAHRNTSFSPERRAEQVLRDYEGQLTADIQHIQSISDTDTANRYKSKYIQKLSSWLSSQSGCASTMITGGSNFPVRQQGKRHRWADNKYTEFVEWRTRIIAAIERGARKAAKAQIDPIQDLKAKIAEAEAKQELIKAVAKLQRKHTFVELMDNPQPLLDLGIKSEDIEQAKRFDAWMLIHCTCHGSLTNNGATIRRLKENLKAAEKKTTIAEKAGGNITHQFEGYEVILNFEIDRIQVRHEQKPIAQVIADLKGIAFKWSPSQGVWQRQLTANALYAFNLVFKTQIKMTA